LKAEPDGVVLQWEHPGGNDIMFLIQWARDGKFHPVDETEGTLVDKMRGIYQFREELPTSGTSQYQVRAFRTAPWEQSEPSEPVTVSIKAPAAGDV
jgi:hypothetical protein